MDDLIEAAREYLTAGRTVIALTGKRPNASIHPHGLREPLVGVPEDSPADRALLERVFRHPDTTGIGLVITYPFFVVDVDGEEGARALQRILGTTDLGLTTPPAARTARGLHLWFTDIRERRSTTLAPKLDIKGVGGYVAAPPSLHESGARYEWLTPLVREGQMVDVPQLPEALETVLNQVEETTAIASQPKEPTTLWRLGYDGRTFTLKTEPTAPDITGLVRAVKEAAEGERNNILAWAAMTAAEEGVSFREATLALGAAALLAGLPAHEATATLKSAYRRKGAM